MQNTTAPARARLTTAIALSIIGALVAGCGSGHRGEARSASADKPSDETSVERGTVEVDVPPECEDGTCFRCGDAVCLKGMICYVSGKRGPSCIALAECGQASCDCALRTFGRACQCTGATTGPTVSCD